ncbi:diaminopimelate epimerase, partial [Streptomyces sp. SID7982]|nr:diaminopimelate epimerase [Streptomyces sp. SID7982]
GGDGLLHVVRSAAHPEARSMAETAEWFMDYRNADGSIAEMCGNGVRVFAHHLQRAGLVEEGDLTVATRGGPKRVHLAKNGDITVSMGQALLPEAGVTVSVDGRSWPARNVNMGNPHAVAFVDDLDHAGDLFTAPPFTPEGVYPEGVNVEFVVDRGPRHVGMRVHERGSGETRSCGT